ncbi:MAG: GNAT family N-acetyltransferase [Myxococcota bacterium]|nr:GNAT family N-acetyltransferase [Myxococcota bacterium]
MIELPDEPRWVEAHGIAAAPRSWRRALGAGAAVGSDRARLVVAYGEVDPSELRALANELAGHTFLVAEALASALPRRIERAILHTLPDPDTLPEYEGATVLEDFSQVPPALVEDFGDARVWTAYVDGAPVSFACAPWRSARWFDISVDTLPGARQLGLATIVAAAMIRDERAQGREPVWGADENNFASLRLAKRLGFVAVDEIFVGPP